MMGKHAEILMGIQRASLGIEYVFFTAVSSRMCLTEVLNVCGVTGPPSLP